MKYCPKHDIHGETCWCCEEQEINAKGAAHREKMYRDPQFLQKRGGANVAMQQVQNAVMAKLAQLSPEQLDNLLAFAQGGGPLAVSPVAGGKRTVIAAAA